MEEPVVKEGTPDHNLIDREAAVSLNKKFLFSGKKRMKTIFSYFLILMLWLALTQYLTAERYSATVRVIGEGEAATIGAGSDKVDFGAIPRAGSSVRFVTIKNQGEGAVYVQVLKSGGIGKFIKISPSSFVLQPGGEEKIEILLEASTGAKEKEYGGKITIYKIPKIF